MNTFLENEWLKAAYVDIVVLKAIKEDAFLTQVTAFHSQQILKKSL